MLKYVDTRVVFAEIPDEITLAINISNCPCHCKGCHSSYLAEDIGTPLNWNSLTHELIPNNKGITCISFMGGDSEPIRINILSKYIKDNYPNIKTAWYSGRQELAKEIELKNFDYIKLGPYIEEFGSLNKETTNQRFYKVHKKVVSGIEGYELEDETYKFWNKNVN